MNTKSMPDPGQSTGPEFSDGNDSLLAKLAVAGVELWNAMRLQRGQKRLGSWLRDKAENPVLPDFVNAGQNINPQNSPGIYGPSGGNVAKIPGGINKR